MRPSLHGSGILVTGGAGFIGSHLVDRLLAEGAHVVAIDNMFLGNEENLCEAFKSDRFTLYKDDAEILSSLESIFQRHAIDIVFNCATKALNYSFINPSNAFNTNVNVVLNLLELQRKGDFTTLCHFSTSEVYGSAVYTPMDENHPRNPTTTYAAGKAAADMAVESYVRMFGADAFIVRPFNNYGPRQNYRGELAAIIPRTVKRILDGLPPELHGTGSQTRDFIYVLDTVDAVVKLYPRMIRGDSVNISADHHVSIANLLTKIAHYLGYEGKLLQKPARVADVECHNASNARVKEMIDFDLTPFADGLLKTIGWYHERLRSNK